MTMPPQQPPGASQVAEAFGKMMGLPSPEKVLGELQRLNNTIEIIQPDIHLLAQAFQGLSGADIRNLSAALGNIKAGDLMRLLNEFNLLSGQIYEKLWGKR